MGIRNVSAGLRTEPDKLTASARLTLVTLCLLTYDTPQHSTPARTYYGGWQLCMARMGAYPDEVAKRRFLRAIAELRECGIVELIEAGRRGSTAVYRLNLAVDNLPDSVDDDTS